MINQLVLQACNRILKANPGVSQQLQELSMKVIQLNLPLLSLTFQINPQGLLDLVSLEQVARDSQITLPLALASYLLHKNQLKAFAQIEITGNKQVAQKFLTGLSQLDYANLLYQHEIPSLGILSIQIEARLKSLIDYLKLVSSNAGLSASHYLQYESAAICDSYSLEQFYCQVDEVKERYELLAKRLERLSR